MDISELMAATYAGWANDASCCIVEIAYKSSGRCFFIGPFGSPQEAMAFDVAFNDEHAELLPDDEPYLTTVYPVYKPEWPRPKGST